MRIVVGVILFGGLGLMTTQAVTLPSLQGDVAGQLTLRGFGQVPPLDWRMQVHPGTSGEHRVQLEVTAPGLTLEFELQAIGNDPLAWRIIRGEVDLVRWWRPLSRRSGITGLPEDLSLTGMLQLSGEGNLRGKEVSGRVTVDLQGGRAGSLKQNWTLEGLAVASRLELTPEGPLVQMLQLRANEGEVVGVGLHNLVLVATGEARSRFTMQTARVDVLGGRITLRPFTLDSAKLELNTTADLEGVALGAMADFVPQALREASGQMSGRVAVNWSAQLGARPGGGSLTLEPTTPASLRLAATPGFLTRHTPARIQWLPDAFGPLARWLAVENPAYDTLRRIEMGDLPLQVEKLQVQLYPDGAAGARSALVEVVARPAGGGAVEQVTFTVNVSGPLEEVLRLSSDERVKMNFAQ